MLAVPATQSGAAWEQWAVVLRLPRGSRVGSNTWLDLSEPQSSLLETEESGLSLHAEFFRSFKASCRWHSA